MGAGVTKVRLTGGEPTLRGDLVELTQRLHALPGLGTIGLTTNGLTLSRKLADLRAAGTGLWLSAACVVVLLGSGFSERWMRRAAAGLVATG